MIKRHRLNQITLVASMLYADAPDAGVHLNVTREVVEDDANAPDGELSFTRDTIDHVIRDAALVKRARELFDAIATHYAGEAATAVKLAGRRGESSVIPAPTTR